MDFGFAEISGRLCEIQKSLMDFIESKGYYLYADTNLNSIYIKNEFWLRV